MKKRRFNDFYEAYNFLRQHNITKTYTKLDDKSKEMEIDNFYKCLDIDVVKVNPFTNSIDDNESLNIKTQVWLEFGGWSKKYNMPCHDCDLDSFGDTFEEAIIELANLVDIHYDEVTGKKLGDFEDFDD